MNRVSTFATILCLGALVTAGTVACSDDPVNSSSSSSGSPGNPGDPGNPGADGGPGSSNFTAYVKDLVVNHTADPTPQTNEQIAAAPADGADAIAESLAAFDTAFFAGH